LSYFKYKFRCFLTLSIVLVFSLLFFINEVKAQDAVVVVYTPPKLGLVPKGTGPCAPVTQVGSITRAIEKTLKDGLKAASRDIEQSVRDNQKETLDNLLADIKGVETSIAKAWLHGWHEESKGVKEAIKRMVSQISAVMMEEQREVQSFLDASLAMDMQVENDIFASESEKEYRPSIHANIAAAAAKGYGRANIFARTMRKAVVQELIDASLNRKEDDESKEEENDKRSSRRKYNKNRLENYKSYFCDPNAAGADFEEICTAENDKIYNADVMPNKFVYNRLTLPVDPSKDPNKELYKALAAMRINMFGSPVGEIVSEDALGDVGGKEVFLNKRGFLARYGAVMSVQNLIESWRMPGSQMGDWLKSILEKEEDDIQDWYRNIDNPSYRELIHAMTADRFYSGRYARDLMQHESDIKMEKLVLTALQSVLLRDYYELLERTALVLAVQVSIMTDGVDIIDSIEDMSTEEDS